MKRIVLLLFIITLSWGGLFSSTLSVILRDSKQDIIMDSVLITVNGKFFAIYDMKDTINIICDNYKEPFEVGFAPLNSEFAPSFLNVINCNDSLFIVIFKPASDFFSKKKSVGQKKTKERLVCPVEN